MSHIVFDRKILRLRRQRSGSYTAGNYDFLINLSTENLENRLLDIKRAFPFCLIIGQGKVKSEKLKSIVRCDYGRYADIEADEEALPFADGSFDACISNLTLHSINDLPGTLVQINRSLKSGGLFLASLYGGQTLWQLRDCLTKAEMSLRQGTSPRVFPFADKQQLGALLNRAGFTMPVVDSETVTVTYDNIFDLMRDLRGMGEGNIVSLRDKRFPGKSLFHRAGKIYAHEYAERNNKIPATVEISYLIGWKP